jgi:hypothetical protein
MDKGKISAVVSIVLSALIAIAAVFGYNILVVQPQFAELEAGAFVGPVAESRAVTDGYVESFWVDKEFTSAGLTTLSGALQGANALVFEGATANAYETTFAITDPTADRTITFPNSAGTVALNPAAGTWEFEGTTANDYETTLAVTDPTADRTVTIGDDTGSVMLTSTPGVFVYGTNVVTGTLSLSHGLTTPQTVFCTLLNDPVANAAHCSATIAGSTVTLKTWKSDGTTAGSVGTLVSWQVAGQQ